MRQAFFDFRGHPKQGSDGQRDWEKPGETPTGGYGRYSFITHFGTWGNKREICLFSRDLTETQGE